MSAPTPVDEAPAELEYLRTGVGRAMVANPALVRAEGLARDCTCGRCPDCTGIGS